MLDKSPFTSVVKHRGFLNLWVNQILIQLSYQTINFALIIWVFKLTNSSTAVAGLMMAIYLPAVILGLFTGVLVDLMDRKKIILIIDLCLMLLFVSMIFTKDSYPAIILLSFLINTLGQFYTPAEASALPLIVQKNQLLTANSMFSATLYSTFLIGFGLAGPLIGLFGMNAIFFFAACCSGIAFVLSFALPKMTVKPDLKGKNLLQATSRGDLGKIKQTGMEEITRTLDLIRGKLPVLISILILSGVQMVIGVLAVLTPSFLETSLHIKATDASYILIIPFGLGIVTGGYIIGKFGWLLIKRVVACWGICFAGLMFVLMGLSPLIFPAVQYVKTTKPLHFLTQPSLSTIIIIGSYLLGIAMVSILVPTQTVLQENAPEQHRGKVFSVLGMVMAGLSLLPVLVSGIMSDVFGSTAIFVSLGFMVMLTGLFGLKPSWFFSKDKLSYRLREFLGLGHWDK